MNNDIKFKELIELCKNMEQSLCTPISERLEYNKLFINGKYYNIKNDNKI